VELVIDESERNQGVHNEQINHGKFAKISSTSLLVKVGASGPALKAGSPVAGSVTILTRWGRLLAGVNTISACLDVGVKGVTRSDTKPTAKGTREHNLTLGGYFGLHGKTILHSLLAKERASGPPASCWMERTCKRLDPRFGSDSSEGGTPRIADSIKTTMRIQPGDKLEYPVEGGRLQALRSVRLLRQLGTVLGSRQRHPPRPAG
jgi:hypothetical protein